MTDKELPDFFDGNDDDLDRLLEGVLEKDKDDPEATEEIARAMVMVGYDEAAPRVYGIASDRYVALSEGLVGEAREVALHRATDCALKSGSMVRHAAVLLLRGEKEAAQKVLRDRLYRPTEDDTEMIRVNIRKYDDG